MRVGNSFRMSRVLPFKRKHQKVDLTKQKVLYVVDVKLKSTDVAENTKKAPEQVTINYSEAN